jgi:hypothetical protein
MILGEHNWLGYTPWQDLAALLQNQFEQFCNLVPCYAAAQHNSFSTKRLNCGGKWSLVSLQYHH